MKERPPSAIAIRQQVDAICRSTTFERETRLQQLLVCLAEAHIAKRSLDQRTIAKAAFGKEIDPTIDGIVRTQYSNLRDKLQVYYKEENRRAIVRIDLRSGSYELKVDAFRFLSLMPLTPELLHLGPDVISMYPDAVSDYNNTPISEDPITRAIHFGQLFCPDHVDIFACISSERSRTAELGDGGRLYLPVPLSSFILSLNNRNLYIVGTYTKENAFVIRLFPVTAWLYWRSVLAYSYKYGASLVMTYDKGYHRQLDDDGSVIIAPWLVEKLELKPSEQVEGAGKMIVYAWLSPDGYIGIAKTDRGIEV